MRVWPVVLIAILFVCATAPVQAAELSISAADITWDPSVDGPASGPISVEIFNSQIDSELLGGWMLTLAIQPVSATGTLQFDSRSLPTTDYVMEGNSTGLMGTITDSSIFAFAGVPNSPFGVAVPASGKYLLDITFKSPDNASGTFALVAVPGLFVTQWSNDVGDDVDFTNIPFGATDPVVLGLVNVVPEPGSIVMALVGLSALGGYGWRQRRARRS